MTKFKITIKDENTAVVSKAFEKKAKIYGTEEYKYWREFLKENPGMIMETKTITRNPNKETYQNMTYKNMRIFIGVQENKDELMKEFEKQVKLSKIQTSPYRAVLAWFCQTFENYNGYKEYFEKLKKEAEEKKKAEISA